MSIPEIGFAVVGGDVAPSTRYEYFLTSVGVHHVDITYNGTVVYVGAGGGLNRWNPKNKLVNAVYPLKIRSRGNMKYGNKKMKCKCATESDVLECLKKKPTHNGWNCQGDVHEAVGSCCLEGFRTIVSTFFYWWD